MNSKEDCKNCGKPKPPKAEDGSRLDLGVQDSQSPSHGGLFAETLEKFLKPEEIAAIARTNVQFERLAQSSLNKFRKNINSEANEICTDIKGHLDELTGNESFNFKKEYKLEYMRIPLRKYQLVLQVELIRKTTLGAASSYAKIALKMPTGAARWGTDSGDAKLARKLKRNERGAILIEETVYSIETAEEQKEVQKKVRNIVDFNIQQHLLKALENRAPSYSVQYGSVSKPKTMSLEEYRSTYIDQNEDESGSDS